MSVTLPLNKSRSTYLSRLTIESEKRLWPRRSCHFMVRMVYPSEGLRKLTSVKATVVDISEGGACINCSLPDLPDHFYIALGKFEYFIGASVVNRSTDRLNIEFLKLQKTELVDVLSCIEFPFSTLDDIKLVPGLKRALL